MVEQISLALKNFSIENKIYKINKKPHEKTQYTLIIPKKESKKYMQIIGFSNKRKEYAPAEVRNPDS